MTTLTFTPESAKKFQSAYNKAVQIKAEIFEFDGCILLVAYAKYLLEHLRNEGVLRD